MTLIELMVTTVVVVIVVLAIGSAIADGIRGWQRTYDRVYADVVTDGYVARKTFDRVIRKASPVGVTLGEGGVSLRVYGYKEPASIALDQYEELYVADGSLLVKVGLLDEGTGEWSEGLPDVICSNVTSCVFKVDGRSAQMILTLNDGTKENTVVSSAVMHNG